MVEMMAVMDAPEVRGEVRHDTRAWESKENVLR